MNRIDQVFASKKEEQKVLVRRIPVDETTDWRRLAGHCTGNSEQTIGSGKDRRLPEPSGIQAENPAEHGSPAAAGPEIWELFGAGEGVGAGTLLSLAKVLRQNGIDEIPVVLHLSFHEVFRYGLEAFTDACTACGVDGLRIPDLPMEEQPQLKVYLLKTDAPYLLQDVCPQSGDRIPDVTGYAKGYLYCTATPALCEEQTEYGSTLLFFLYAAEAVCPLPLILDFHGVTPEEMKPYLAVADGMVTEKQTE